ncbi:uncharacterized protein si:ch211-196c10.15 [Poeciliopsis prolifica]|uniref:uncharacterized protein si:ch211-196c10.15 n=1 Tax=Poeciliopsis prolifica TaxID=188132 RepID=UPI0024145124|nr:uncharacterized protein si:ch211-196c10.15 [Poeciliopsis prolifica]
MCRNDSASSQPRAATEAYSRNKSTGRPREVMIQFSMRHYRDTVWKAAKQSPFLKSSNLRFKEDLSPEDRQGRNMLWPLVKKACEEGKTAFYIGPKPSSLTGMEKEKNLFLIMSRRHFETKS